MDSGKNTTLFFIADDRQFAAAYEAELIQPGFVVATASLDVYWTARNRNISSELLSDYLPPGEATRHDELARRICRRLGESWSGRFTYGSCDLPALHRFDPFYLLACFLNISLSAARCLEALRPDTAFCFPERESPCLGNGTCLPPDTFNLAAALAAAREGVPVKPVELPGRPRTTSGARPWPSWDREPARRRLYPEARPRTLIFSASTFDAEIEPLMDALVSDAVLAGSMPMPLDAPFIPWTLLQFIPAACPLMPSWDDLTELIRSEIKQGDLGRHTETLCEDAFTAFLLKGWRQWLSDGARAYAAARLCREALRPARVVIPYDADSSSIRCTAEAFREAGLPVVSVDHAGLASPFASRENEGATADVAVWGPLDENGQKRWRAPSARIAQVGSMRRDLEAARVLGNHPRTAPVSRRRVLITTSQHTAELMPGGMPSEQDIERWWRELSELTRRRSDVEWALRRHPRYDQTDFYRHIQDTWRPCFNGASGALPDELAGTDVMLLFAAPSTAAVLAVLAGRPVVHFKPPELEPWFWQSPMEKMVVCVNDIARAEDEIERLLRDEAYYTETVSRQRHWLQGNLAAVGPEAVRRMIHALDEATIGRGQGADAPPDPAARWVLDLVMAIDYGLRGVLSRRDFLRRLDTLRREGRALRFEGLTWLAVRDLPDYFMNLTFWALWRRPESERSISRERPWMGWYLWQVYRALPPSIRPPRKWVLTYLRRSLEEEKLFNPGSRFWRWVGRRRQGYVSRWKGEQGGQGDKVARWAR